MQEPLHAMPSTIGPRFRPFASPDHQVSKGRYITSNDPRGYMFVPSPSLPVRSPHRVSRRPVYEYPLNGQWIMMDIDDGYILWTGIWKGGRPYYPPRLEPTLTHASFFLVTIALGNSKGLFLVVALCAPLI
jgi:hypothetical protein